MESRMEMLLNALINGETIDFEPQSRMEAYLKNCINKTGTEGLPPPESRADALMYKLAESIKASYIDISDSTATAEDIRLGKTAYIADGKVTGTAERSLKKLLDARKKAHYLFDGFKNDSIDDFIEYADTSNVTEMANMFNGCLSLTTVPSFDTSKVTGMASMFNGCTSLTTVPKLDMFKVSSTSSMFSGCASLTNCFLRNIKRSLTIGSGTTYGHLLTLESLLFMIKELIDTGSNKTFAVGTANLEKLANVYVKTVEITDEMRTEDPNIDLKLPFETCESTDEGAKLITEYVGDKHWTLV